MTSTRLEYSINDINNVVVEEGIDVLTNISEFHSQYINSLKMRRENESGYSFRISDRSE